MRKVKWNKDATFLKRETRVAVINGKRYIKINSEYFNILNQIIDSHLDITDLSQYFLDNEDYKIVQDLIERLMQIEVLEELKEDDKEYSEGSKLKDISFIITNRCNLSCIHCSQDACNLKENVKEMSYQEICRVINLLDTSVIETITITGGEPLVRKDFFDIAEYIRSKFKGTLILMTNALLITEDNVEKIINLFDHISISIDGIDEELTSMIRGKGVFQKVIEKVKLLHKYDYMDIELSAILPASNEVERKFDELCKKLEVAPVPRTLLYGGRALDNYEHINRVYQDYLSSHGFSKYNYVQRLCIGSLQSCEACRSNITIDPAGDLYPCNLLEAKKFKIGNLLENSNLINEYERSLISEKIGEMKDMKVEPCVQCEVRKLCWFCLADYESFMSLKTKTLQDDYCKERKKSIYNYYFGG